MARSERTITPNRLRVSLWSGYLLFRKQQFGRLATALQPDHVLASVTVEPPDAPPRPQNDPKPSRALLAMSSVQLRAAHAWAAVPQPPPGISAKF